MADVAPTLRSRAARAVALLLASAVGALAAPPVDLPSPGDRWFALRTANFTLFSETTESKTREIALDLERLRAVLLRLRRSLTASSPVPTDLYVFKSSAAFEPYVPLSNGKRMHIDGYFQPTPDGNYISLTASWNSDPRPLIYHEYLHYFLNANFPRQPLWFDEGTAEFYRSFHATGSEAQVGLPVEEHIGLLRSRKMIPLEELFAVDHKSPDYNEALRQGVFYAESWALVHYLVQGNPARTPQLSRFLALLDQGKPRDEAFREAFQTDYATLFGELYAYVRNNRYLYARYSYKDLDVPTEVKVEPLSYPQTLVRLGELLAHQYESRAPEAEAYFRAALAAEPEDPAALTGLGFLRVHREEYAEAAEYFRRATASERADYRAFYYDGQLRLDALTRQWGWPLTEAQRSGLEGARASLRRSIALNPSFPEARVVLGRTFLLEEPEKSGEGITELTVAAALLPARDDVAHDLAELSKRKHEYDAAVASRSDPASAPPPQAAPNAKAPTPHPGSRVGRAVEAAQKDHVVGVESVNALLKQGKEDEAVAAMENLVAHTHDEMHAILEDELVKLKAGVARNKAMHAYNAAIALYNRRDYASALAAFEKLATDSPDADIAKAARAKATEVRSLLKKK